MRTSRRGYPFLILGLLCSVTACGKDEPPPTVVELPDPDPDPDPDPEPEPNPAAQRLAVGDAHACALDSSGRANCWGRNRRGQLGSGSAVPTLSPEPVSGGHTFTWIVAGENHTCALDDTGHAWCWGGEAEKGTLGDGAGSDSTVPVRVAGDHMFVSLSRAADDHVCGIDEEAAAWCWGEAGVEGRLGDGVSTAPQLAPVRVAGDIQFERIGAGWVHTCGLDVDGYAYCWGLDYTAVPEAVSPDQSFVDVSVGFRHACAIDDEGATWCWGSGDFGQLGRGSLVDSPKTPERVIGGHTFVRLSGGRDHTCGWVESGEAYCWGRAETGQLGDGTRGQDCLNTPCRPGPVAVEGGHHFGVVTGGAEGSTCGITVDDAVLCWGNNTWGQLGLGADSPLGPRVAPGDPVDATNFTQLSLGSTHACGVAAGQGALCWGSNLYGQLGIGTSVGEVTTPLAVVSGATFTQVSGGFRHGCAVDTTRQAWCWGTRYPGHLGDGSEFSGEELSPVPVVGGLSFEALEVGRFHTCGIDTGAAAWCWGQNNLGQLGAPGVVPRTWEPVPVVGGHTFASLSLGQYFTCALDTSGAAHCWGENTFGQLGNGSTAHADQPTEVAGGRSLTSLAVGWSHVCGLGTDGTAYCWGQNQVGQLGNGGIQDASTPTEVSGGHRFGSVSAGAGHTCGVDLAGTLWCWGGNWAGGLGDGTLEDRPVPTRVDASIAFDSVASGSDTSCGLAASGAVYCWGRNEAGQLGDGTVSVVLVPARVAPFGP